MSPSWLTTLLASLFLFSQIFSCLAQVPLENTFKFVNEGELGPYVVEYRVDYRVISIFNNPFQLCFYNTTPNAWTLALRMGTVRSESLMRWVWEANRGNPVKENATFTFGTNGNLVLADADGRIAWQTNTANKGVTGFKLLPNGNMVLHDSKGKFVWQSFNYPTDTLLVGQTLRLSGPNKLVSRASVKKNVNGPYSLVVQPKLFAIYNRTKLGVELAWFDFGNSTLESVKLNSGNQRLKLDYRLAKSTKRSSHVMAFTKYNTTLTYLRLEIDGNLKAYTFVRDEEADEFRWKVQKHAVREKSRLPDRKPLLENFQAMMSSSEQRREAGGEGEGSSSTTAITLAQSDDHHHHHQLSPPPQLSRYESQKRRDWNTFGQYLKNHKPPVPLPQCNYNHVLDFLRYLDQFGKTKVHLNGCVFFGQVEQVGPCTCPLKQAWGSLDALIGRLRAAYEENGGLQETNPFANSAIRIHLREVRDSQAKARGIPYKKKKKKRKIQINSSNNNGVNSS